MSLPSEIPAAVRRAAVHQFWSVGVRYFGGWALTYLGAGLLAALTARRQYKHPQGKAIASGHSLQYLDQGSSGNWEYWNSPVTWLQPWNNLEDGMLGEPSGKHSARCGGHERCWWNRFLWVCRNPYNWAKRTDPRFYCPVNECNIRHWGDYSISDKAPVQEGWYLVEATHRITGQVWFGYRSVMLRADGKVRQVNLGFKLKPSHRDQVQDQDDRDKAFTLRYQHASVPD